MAYIALTPAAAKALKDARFVTRSKYLSDLLQAALDGDEAALAAIRRRWPKSTSRARTVRLYVRMEVAQALLSLARNASTPNGRNGRKSAFDGIGELLRRK